MSHVWKSLGAGALIVLLTVVAYLPALHGGFIWDDDFYVTGNQTLRSVEGLGKIWTRPGIGAQQYYPLSFTGLWVQYHLWKLQPFPYHLVNILLHAVNALLLWGVLRRLEIPGSWWAAAIFALHPVQVESVAWITEFKNLLAALFSLLSLLAFLRFRPLSASGTGATWDGRFYAPAFLLFLCALLSKTAVCCLPVVLAVLLWWKLDRVTKRDVLALIPWFVASLALGLITVRVESRVPEASTTGWVVSMIQRGLLAGRALWFYVGKVFWPYPLTFVYPRWQIAAADAGQYWYPLAALAVPLALWLARRRIGKGPLAAVVCFAAMLWPVLGFLDVYFFRYSYVADHFQYLACSGLIALTVAAGATMAQRADQWGRRLGALVAVVVLLALGLLTWRQAYIYHDLETLWHDTLAKNPQAWMAHYNLGNGLLQTGQLEEAIKCYDRVLRLKPDYAEAHNNLGMILAQTGRVPEAIGHFEQALRLKPDYTEAHSNLGLALIQRGRAQEAIEHFEQAVRINPQYVEAQINWGIALSQLGRAQEAIGHWEQALRVDPDSSVAHNDLGGALLRLGRVQEAIEHYEQAVRLKPDYAEAHYNCGLALARQGRLPEAIGHFEQALRIKPDYAGAHNNLALALSQVGRIQEATEHWEQALRLNPNIPEAHYGLGLVLEQSGRIREAIGHYEQAARLKADYLEAQNNLGWLLATLAPAEGGNPARAVTLAQRACERTGNRVAAYLDTLAAAYAAAGRFDEAVATAQKAADLARSAGQAQVVKEIETRLELYRSGRVYRR